MACATSIVVVLALGACSSGDQKVTSGCRMPRGHAVAVGGSERMTIGFGDRGATAWFTGAGDLAVFHADDGRTMTFVHITVKCQ